MGQYVGLDVSLEATTVHVLDEQGKRVWRGTCVSIRRRSRQRSASMLPKSCGSGWKPGP